MNAELTTLPPSVLMALSKAFADAASTARDSLEVGNHEVAATVTLSVKGEVSVSADTQKAPTASIPLLPTLALFAKRMGIQREAALNILTEVMMEAIVLDKDASKALLAQSGVADVEKQIKDQVIASLPKTPVKGGVRVKVEVTPLNTVVF